MDRWGASWLQHPSPQAGGTLHHPASFPRFASPSIEHPASSPHNSPRLPPSVATLYRPANNNTRKLLLLNTQTVSTTSSAATARRAGIDAKEVLRIINKYRRQHGAPPLQWSSTLREQADMRARHETTSSGACGENLARNTNPAWRDHTFACIAAIQRWQQEEDKYDYERPGLSSGTDHFTNNVWKNTTHVGFGVSRAKYKGKSTVWVVAFFYPKGNQAGEFERNVLPRSVCDGETDSDGSGAPRRVAREDHRLAAAAAAAAAAGATPSFVRVSTVNTEVSALQSMNGKYVFEVIPNRDVVVRRGDRIVWKSGTGCARPVSAPYRLVFQKNGDLVAYDSAARIFWSTDTANCGPAPYTLTLKDDGNCVLFDADWVARWASALSGRPER